MHIFLILLTFFLFLLFLIGLINPKWVPLKGKRTRKKILLYYGLSLFVCFMFVGITNPGDTLEKEQPKDNREESISIETALNKKPSEVIAFTSDMTEEEFFILLKKDDRYNECIEISDRVSKYKKNKNWIIETTKYLADKCYKWDEERGERQLRTLLSELRANKWNYTEERHEMYDSQFKGFGKKIIRRIYINILEDNHFTHFSEFLPIDKENLLDYFNRKNFIYSKIFSEEGDYKQIIFSQKKDIIEPEFWVGWDDNTQKVVSMTIPIASLEWKEIKEGAQYYEAISNAFSEPYDFSIQAMEIFNNNDLKKYLYQQIVNIKNYNREEFWEHVDKSSSGSLSFYQISYDDYLINIDFFLDTIFLTIQTKEIMNFYRVYRDLREKYLYPV
ncbi:MAG: hypothetical protein AB7E45_00575 [Candidatus Caldatribacteriota bacterium]